MDDTTLLAYNGLQTSAGILGSFASANLNYKNSRKLMKYQFDLNQQAIDAQNAYNLPSAQMQRLSDAGLNPNLVYGNGSVVGNTSDAAKTGLGQPGQAHFEDVIMKNNLALQRAQIANIEADTELKHENALTQGSVREKNTQQSEYLKYFTNWNYATWDLREQTIQLQNAVSKRQYGLIGYYMQNLQSTIQQRDQITEQTVQTMAQARTVQLKQLELNEKNLEQQWKHWKNQDSIGFQNARSMMVSALAAQMQGSAALQNAGTNAYNAKTQRGYLDLARERFDKMSDLEQSKLYQQVLNDIAYRDGYLNYLAPFMENRILLMDSQYDSNRQRLQNMQQQYDLGIPGIALDFMNFGNKFGQ